MSVFLSPSTIYKSSFGIHASGTKMNKKTAICPVSHPEIFILAFFCTHLRNLQLLQTIENSSLHGGKNDDKKTIWGTWKQMWNVSLEENGWWSALMLGNSRKQHVSISVKSGDKLPNIYTYWVAGISEPSISISRMLSTRFFQAGRFDITSHLWHAAVMGPVLVPSRK